MALETPIPDAGELSKDDILDELNNDDIKPIDDKTEEAIDLSGKSDKEVKIGDDEEKEEEEDDEEPEEKVEIEEEVDEFHDVPKRQEILKAFPELFKKFPGVEKAIYREQKYAEVFPTIAEATEAAQRLEDFKSFESELFDGSIKGVLTSLKSSNEQSFQKVTGNILRTLAEVDEKAYYGTLNHIVKNSIWAAFNSAKESGDEQLEIAAQLMHKYVYGNTKIEKPVEQQQNQPDEKETKLSERERSFAQRELGTAVNDVTTRTDNVIKSTVDKYIDPKNAMTSYVRNKAVEDVMVQVRQSITTDKRFRANLDQLWQSAQRNGFNEDSKLKIRNALISKAKVILPGIIKSVKGKALEGSSTRTREASESRDEKPISQGRPASSTRSPSKDAKQIPRGMKSIDFLMQD